ncbi:MAG: DMT family transporter [Desulfohalobiaceae bacterium]|nr:DMT family transporter [Desulfohalobiaceae bacterium]
MGRLASLIPYMLVVLAPLIWSTNFVLGKVLIKDLSPFVISACRFGVASVLLTCLLWFKEGFSLPSPSTWPYIVIAGLTGVFGFNTLIYLGLWYTTSINTSIINAFNPVLVGILAIVWLKESLDWKRFGAFFVSILGVFLITIHGSWKILMSLQFNPGDLIIFANTFVWAVYSISGKKMMQELSVLAATTYANWVGILFLVPTAIFTWQSDGSPFLNFHIWGGLVYLGVFASFIAFLSWYYAIDKLGPTVAANFYNLIPVFVSILAIVFLGERIHLYHIIGTLLVLLGIYLGSGYALDIFLGLKWRILNRKLI